MGWCFHQIAAREVKKNIEKKYRILGELFCGIAIVVIYNRFAEEMTHFYFVLFMFSWLYLLSVMDLLSQTYSSRIFYWFSGLLLISKLINVGYIHVYSGLEVAFLFLVLDQFMKKIFHKQMIGEGDVMLFIVLALLFGVPKIHWIILYSSIFAIPFCQREKMAFVPFISVATFFVLYFGVPLF